MKFYLYISDAKVEMLAGQLRRGLGGLIANWKVDVSAGIASVGAEGRSVDPTRYRQIEKITRYIRKHDDCGTIDAPGTFVFDTLDVSWGPFGPDKRVAFFTGATPKTVFALGGSSSYLLQAPKSGVASYPHGGSATWILVSTLLHAFGLTDNRSYNADAIGYTDALFDAIGALAEDYDRGPVPPTRVEFLAKRIAVGSPGGYADIVREKFDAPDVAFLGSPLYVAMTD